MSDFRRLKFKCAHSDAKYRGVASGTYDRSIVYSIEVGCCDDRIRMPWQYFWDISG